MPKASVVIEFNHFPSIMAELPGEVGKIVKDTVYDIDDRVFSSMIEAKHGHVYGGHQASAPGEAPAIETGELSASMQQDFEVSKISAVGYEYTENPYSAFLELGTTRMAPRPFLVPAAEAERQAFERAMRDLLKQLGKV